MEGYGILMLLLVLIGLTIYLIPSLVAGARWHRNRGAITALNICLGWTLLGWVISLVWAFTADVEPKEMRKR